MPPPYASAAVPLRCLVVDDDPLALQIIGHCIARTPGLEAVGFLRTGLEALDFLREHPVDALFLDVELPLFSGLDLLTLLPHKLPTVLISGNPDYAVRAFDYAVVDYLLKPISYPRFLLAVRKVKSLVAARNRASEQLSAEQAPAFIFVRAGTQLVRVNFADVCYLKASGNYVTIVLEQQELLIFGTLRTMRERFPAADFITTHRSFLVNRRHIESVGEGELFVKGKALSVSPSLRAKLLTQLNLL